MSDFSGLEQSFALPPLPPQVLAAELPEAASVEVQPHELGFRRLRGHHEIARVLSLRQEISLPASALADAGFGLREKKETRSAW
jgi:hypothetical protein